MDEFATNRIPLALLPGINALSHINWLDLGGELVEEMEIGMEKSQSAVSVYWVGLTLVKFCFSCCCSVSFFIYFFISLCFFFIISRLTCKINS